jgi:hypothetical protein
MAFSLFGKKESQPKKSVVDLVTSMRSVGQQNDQIVQALQKDGYNAAEIFDAIQIADTQAALRQPITQDHMSAPPINAMNLQPQSIIGNENNNMANPYQQPPIPPPPSMNMPSNYPPMGNMPPMPPMNMGGPAMAMPPQPADNIDTQQIEALIEAVIEEKWQDIERNISKVIEWKESTEQVLGSMQQQITDLKSQIDSLQKAIIGKIGDYDKNILEVGAQLGAMEKAFSQVLPTFTENINELNRITSRLKK